MWQVDGMFEDSPEGVPQGGPLSPLLGNIMLNECDNDLLQKQESCYTYAKQHSSIHQRETIPDGESREITQAFNKRSPEGELTVRTDNGPQFISMAFEMACEKLSVKHERISNSSPNSNAHIESFHSILEEDCLKLYEFESFAEAYQVITEFMNYYNEVRLHSGIGYRPLLEYHNEIMSKPENVLKISA